MGEQLEDIYRDYIAALNGRRFDDLDRFTAFARTGSKKCGR
jgi:hypothetical protein